MKFKKDGKVYEGTIEMMNAHCGSAVCSDCDILNRCRKNESCSDYAYANPVEVAHYLGFEAIENDGEPSIGEIVEKSVQNLAHWHKENIEREKAKRRNKDVKRDIREVVEKYGEDIKPDPVNRPAHYTSGGIECIDAMTAAFGAEAVKDFCLCNAFKYLWRHRNKNGVEDLKKARWYLNRLITDMEVKE